MIMRKIHKIHAFTLMELVTVLIIVTITAAFVIPNYQNSVARSHEKDILANVRAMAAAQEMYRAENGTYWPIAFGTQTTVAINTNLRLGLIENQSIYQCSRNAALGWFVQGRSLDSSGATLFVIRAYANTGWQPFCLGALPCPTCTAGGCP